MLNPIQRKPIEVAISALQAESSALSTLAGRRSTLSSIASQRASYERRTQEWEFQKQMAGKGHGYWAAAKLRFAQDHVRVVGQERRIAEMQSEFAEQTMEFLSTKFTNVELYRWMSNVLEGVYSFFLQEATAMAQLAQSQLGFERQLPPPPYIQGDYWSVPDSPAAAIFGRRQCQ